MLPQLIPLGEDATVPPPVPLFVTDSRNVELLPPMPRMMALSPAWSTIAPFERLISANTSLEPDCAPLSQ